MLVDAHVHVWQPMPTYPDLTATIVSPASASPIGLLDQYLDEHAIDRAVLVQPIYPGDDNSYVAECAAARPERYAAVCVVDPHRPDAAEQLRYWVNERGCKGLRLRPKVAAESAIFGDERTFALWRQAQELGAVINILCDRQHLPVVGKLADRFSVPIIIDHMGHPDTAAGANSASIGALLALARYDNIWIKVSGYYYYSKVGYPFADCHEIFRAVYDRFGPRRLIWGSDFPHLLLKTGYRRMLKLHERAFGFLSDADSELIMGGNAAGLYWREVVP